MANLKLTLTPHPILKKKKLELTNTEVGNAIKKRMIILDYSKTAMSHNIIAEVMRVIENKSVIEKIGTKKLTGLPADKTKYAGTHKLEIFVGIKKANRLELVIEKEPKLDIKKNCPLFANDKGMKANREYLGGNAGQSHVHIYGTSFHLKLGGKRFNIVQQNKRYDDVLVEAHKALTTTHKKYQYLAPYVAAALKKLNKL